MKIKKYLSLGLSIAAFVFSVLTFLIAYTSFSMPDLDTASFLVTILSVLVTTLLGWQIFTFISIDEIVEKALKKVDGETNQKFMLFAYEFYSNFISMINDNSPTEQKLSSLMGFVIYGSEIENLHKMEKEYFFYKKIITHFEQLLQKEVNQIRNLDEEVKNALLDKINHFPYILILSKLKEILEQPSTEGDPDPAPQPSSKNQQANNNFGCNITQNQ